MKKLYLTCLMVFVPGLATCALADGPTPGTEDPVVTAPRDAWTGLYVGLAYGRVTRTETGEDVECLKLGQPYACDDPIFDYYPEYKEEVRTAWSRSSDEDRTGLLVGYRWDLGRVVPGVELGLYDGEVLPGVQLGWDLGGLLPYAHLDSDGAAAGLDLRLSPSLTAGVRAGQGGVGLNVKWGF